MVQAPLGVSAKKLHFAAILYSCRVISISDHLTAVILNFRILSASLNIVNNSDELKDLKNVEVIAVIMYICRVISISVFRAAILKAQILRALDNVDGAVFNSRT